MTTTTATQWKLDNSHSEIQFKVRHLVISTVTGKFKTFEGGVETNGDDFENAKVWFKADVNSIESGTEFRDTHLKGEDFFNAEHFPHLTFKSTSFEKTGEGKFIMKGDMTISETTLPVHLNVDFAGIAVDPWGNVKAGFEINGKINRKEFGLHWHAVTDAGGLVAGDEVAIHINAEVDKVVA